MISYKLSIQSMIIITNCLDCLHIASILRFKGASLHFRYTHVITIEGKTKFQLKQQQTYKNSSSKSTPSIQNQSINNTHIPNSKRQLKNNQKETKKKGKKKKSNALTIKWASFLILNKVKNNFNKLNILKSHHQNHSNNTTHILKSTNQ